MYSNIKDNVSYIAELTVIAELKKSINVFGVSLKRETPFTDAAIICIRGFFMSKIYGGRVGLLVYRSSVERNRENGQAVVGAIPTHPHQISGSKRFFPDSLKRYIENEYHKKQALFAPTTCCHDKWLKQRIMASLQHVSSLVSFRRLIVERGNKSTLTLYMGGDCISWGKVQ